MIANITRFGNMEQNDANLQLKENLKAVKTQAEALLQIMDITAGRIKFEDGEMDKWIALRQAILDFRSLEVNPNLAQNVMISVENMDKLHDTYGAYTESAVNRIINDLIADDEANNVKGKIKATGKHKPTLQEQLARI